MCLIFKKTILNLTCLNCIQSIEASDIYEIDACDMQSPLLNEKQLKKIAKRRHDMIEKELRKASKIYNSTVRLLLLGIGESGKSTIIKQMRLIHSFPYTLEEKMQYVVDIKRNLRDSVVAILKAMNDYELNFATNHEELNFSRDFVLKNAHYLNNFANEVPFDLDILWDHIEALWANDLVKKLAKRGNDYMLFENAEYFLNRINVIRNKYYIADEQDIVRCRALTTCIVETKFVSNDIKFHVFDVGGQRGQRRKWIQCFNQLTAIIFVADISSFNINLREDPSTNRLVEALETFKQIWTNRYLDNISIILFLNKYDIFTKKIVDENCKLEETFPLYKNYTLSNKINKSYVVPLENGEVTRAKMFILQQFINITQSSSKSWSKSSSYENESFEDYDSDSEFRKKFCLPYFTCAVDTENVKRVFKGCRNILRREHLIKTGLI